jgi:hypothetical protein
LRNVHVLINIAGLSIQPDRQMRERIPDLFEQANHRRSVDVVFVLGARYQGEVQLFWDDKPRKAPSGRRQEGGAPSCRDGRFRTRVWWHVRRE